MKKKSDRRGLVHVDVQTEHAEAQIDMIIIIEEQAREPAGMYDFSDLAGKLRWQGNAVKTQRQLRDEW